MENRCVCCGEVIPEGRQVCISCMQKSSNDKTNKIAGWIELTDLYSDTKILFNLNAIEFISNQDDVVTISINSCSYFVKESYKKIIDMIKSST